MRTAKTSKTVKNLSGILSGFRGLCVLIGAAVLLAALFAALPPGASTAPAFEAVRAAYSRSESVLLDRHEEIVQEQRTNSSARRLEWVPLSSISPALVSAMLYAEDRRFYQHHGVDWTSLAGALASSLGSGPRGASTLTMQLASQLDKELQPAAQRRTFLQKWRQIQSARALERRWSKPQILEAYLNLVTFRGELQGLAAAANGLFGKQPHGLTSLESVILAALVRSPNAGADQVARRATTLASAMQLGLGPAEIPEQARQTLSHPYFIKPQAQLAPQAARRLFRGARARVQGTPHRIVSTLDRSLQQFATDTLRRHIMTVRAQNVRDGAVLVLDNRTGEVLAYVGNTGDQGSARYVDGIQARRQAGSTLKPFVYGAALDMRLLTAASLLDDSPLDVPVLGGAYRPSNYDKSFNGPVTARIALASSLNVPAVKTLNLIGIDTLLRVLTAAGFEELQSAEFYGPSLALGAADVCLWELTNAYRCLADSGVWSPVRMTFEEPPGAVRRVFPATVSFLLSDILSDRESRSRTFSLESPLSTRFWTAVKTGTSKDMRDNWCVGYSDSYTVGVWAGNFSGEPMWNVSGITGAAPVWVEIMNWLHRDRTSSPPSPPPGILAHAALGDRAGNEWFIRGTELAVVPGEAISGFRIAYPATGTVVAMDPDIPAEEQKLFFEAQPQNDQLHWVLDGHPIGGAGALLLWTPMRGKHILTLVDSSERALDSITFEVRGHLR